MKGEGKVMVGVESEGGYDGNVCSVVEVALGMGVEYVKIGKVESPEGSGAVNCLLEIFYNHNKGSL